MLGPFLDVDDVRERGAGHPVGPVGGREGVRVTAEQLVALLLAEILDERLLEVVGPRARGGREHHLDLAGVELRHQAGLHVGQRNEDASRAIFGTRVV